MKSGHGIYIASRVRHAEKWIAARNGGINIISTWIDEAGEGESPSMVSLWQRCIREAQSCKGLVLYREDDEMLKGGLIEAGTALGANRMVYAVGFNGPNDMDTFSFLYHPFVIRCDSITTAFSYAGSLR